MDVSKKTKVNILIGASLTLVIAGLMLLKFTPLEAIEDKLYDYRFKIRGNVKQPDTVVIAAIDEKSIEKLGRWPWDRDKIAQLVDSLVKAEAELIVFDVIFSEHEKNDALLGSRMREAGNVLLPIVFEFDKETEPPSSKVFLDSAFMSIENPERFSEYNPISAKRVLVPVPKLIEEVMALGHINMFPDGDGTLRWETLAVEHNGYLFPSITLKAAASYLGVPHEKIIVKATEGIQLAKRFIPTDRFGRTLINYYGSNETFKYISISDIIEGKTDPELLEGKIVLIGATAVGIYDLRVTPFSAAMPGIEKHASVITSILENKFVRTVPLPVNIAIVLLTGILFTILIPRYKALGAFIIAGILLLSIFLPSYYFFASKGLWINLTYPTLNILLILISATAYNYASEEIYAKRMRSMFSSYVTEKVVNELIKNPEMAKLGGDRREISILFSDVRGFTTFSEKHRPEEVVQILNEYLGTMTDVVFRWEGTLDKFIGDAILAFWGAPMPQENHAELAVKCALDMEAKILQLQKKWAAEGKSPLDMGIGINTGEVLVGNIGAEGKKMDYTVIGDNVNLGSRIEGLTRKYDTRILITEFTLTKVRDSIASNRIGHVAVTGLEKVVVKGKALPVEIFEVKSLEEGALSTITECDKDKCVVTLKDK